MEGLEGVERCKLGIGILDRLGGLGGCPNADALLFPEVENVGDRALERSCSTGRPSIALVDIERESLGVGMLLGVFARCRGVVAVMGVTFCEGVWVREGGRRVGKGGSGGWWKWDCDVDMDEVMGDHGLDDAIEALDKLLRYGVPCIVISALCPEADGGRLGGVALMVRALSSGSTFVELFHAGFGGPLLFPTEFVSSLGSVLGEDSGVRLWLYLCTGRSGVEGVLAFPRTDANRDDFWLFLLFGGGSEEGVRVNLFLVTERGVTEARGPPVSLRANIRRGDIDSDIVLAALEALDMRGALGGVMRYPFFVDAWPDVLDPASLDASPLRKILRTFSISASVRVILSRKLRHLCADSACRRSVSPFLVTRSWTPLSMIERTFDVAGM